MEALHKKSSKMSVDDDSNRLCDDDSRKTLSESGNNDFQNEEEKIMRVKVVIVGAGAAGLQCAQSLLSLHGGDNNNDGDDDEEEEEEHEKMGNTARSSFSPQDILILEGRNRIGGRIHTTTETITTVDQRLFEKKGVKAENSTTTNNCKEVNFPRDHGAAWLHGTAVPWGTTPVHGAQAKEVAVPVLNPMMELLFLEQSNSDGELGDEENIYDAHLKPICSGNPWMRPATILHKGSNIALFVAGRQLPEESPAIEKALQRHFAILEQVAIVGDDLYSGGRGLETANISLKETVNSVVKQDKFQKALLQDCTEDDIQIIEVLTPFYLHMLECWYGASSSELQLCEFTLDSCDNFGDNDYTEEGDFSGPHCTLRNGMRTVLEPLLKNGISDRIRLSEKVVKISCSNHGNHNNNNGGVIVTSATGLVVKADYCVVTIPAGVLKEAIIKNFFEPPLNEEKQEAVGVLNMGAYKKVFLTFDHIFWPPEQAFLGMIRRMKDIDVSSINDDGNPLGNYLLFDNLWSRNGIPCIEAVLFGFAGKWATHKSDSVIRDVVLDFMNDAMGLGDDKDLKTHCTNCHVTRWEEDPMSRGAYSCMSLGAMTRHVEELNKPSWKGRLIFAGEATVTEFEGSVHGALFSGKNSAKKVCKHISSNRGSPFSQTR